MLVRSLRQLKRILAGLLIAVLMARSAAAAETSHIVSGMAYVSNGDYDRAIAEFDKAIQLKLDDAEAYKDRGIAYANKGAYDRAIADYEKAIQLKPGYAEAYFGRGYAYNGKGDRDRAITDFTKAIELNPDYVAPYGNRGSAYIAKGDYDRAITDLDKAIQLQPGNGYAYYSRGLAYERSGNAANALRDFRSAAHFIPESDPWHSKALARVADTNLPHSSGTGIVVSVNGLVLTNDHVIDKCDGIEIRRSDDTYLHAVLLYRDRTDDLALLKIDKQIAEKDVAAIRTTPAVRNGEYIAVFGYPLLGTLSSSGNITGGNVSALEGMHEDSGSMQITAPIQPGNSGGPILDQSANVIGVVAQSLSDRHSNDMGMGPQNVNFAIKASVVMRFLDAHGVSYRTASTSGGKLDLPSIADVALRFTVPVVCQ